MSGEPRLREGFTFCHTSLQVVNSPLQNGQFLIQHGQPGATGHVCKERSQQSNQLENHRKFCRKLTERIEKVRYSLDAGCDDFDVLPIGPVLMDLALIVGHFSAGQLSFCQCWIFWRRPLLRERRYRQVNSLVLPFVVPVYQNKNQGGCLCYARSSNQEF